MPIINLALSGGGLKSFSQVAVIKKLQELDIKINAIAGTSMGALIASLVAIGLDASAIETELLKLEAIFDKEKYLLKPSSKHLPFTQEKLVGGYVDGEIIENILDTLFDKYDIKYIKDVKIPLAIPSVDLKSGKLIVFVSHPDIYTSIDTVETNIKLSKAIRASASIPLVISSCPFKDYLLIDGGIKLNVPVPLLRSYSTHKILAITAKDEVETLSDTPGIVTTINQVYKIMSTEFDIYLSQEAEYQINIPVGRKQLSIGKGKHVITKSTEYIESLNIFDKLKSV